MMTDYIDVAWGKFLGVDEDSDAWDSWDSHKYVAVAGPFQAEHQAQIHIDMKMIDPDWEG